MHADLSSPELFAPVAERLRQAGVELVGIGVQYFANDPGKETAYFECARLAGVGLISADFAPGAAPECFAAAGRLAERYGVRLAIHNHGGRHWLGSAQMLKTVLAQNGPWLGLMLDTAWALDAGEDPVELVKNFGQRLYGVHLKDFAFDRARRPEDVVIGDGNLKLPELFGALQTAGFSGPLILEYEGDADGPAPALRRGMERAEKHLA